MCRYTSKKGEIFESEDGKLIFVCSICDRANIGLKEVENHLNTHISCVIKEEPNAEFIIYNNDTSMSADNLEVISHLHTNISDILEESSADKNMYPELKAHCEYCRKRFPCSGLRNKHVAAVHNGRLSPYNCSFCNASFSVEKLYFKHIQYHKLATPIDCPLCGHIFKSMQQLMDHINGKEIFHLPAIVNHQSTTTGFYSQRHLQRSPRPSTIHPFRDKMFNHYECDTCGKIYGSRYHIRVHLYSHLEVKPFPCEICGWRFAHPTNLQTHLNRHAGIKPHACSYCGKVFSTRTELNTHVRTHTGEKGHICSYCGKQFATSGRLSIHVRRSHTKERRHKCPYNNCFESYYTPRDLKVHIRNHTGERPIICELCETTFANPKVYRVHMQLHNSEKLFTCKFCPSKFSQSSGRRGHEKRVHGAT